MGTVYLNAEIGPVASGHAEDPPLDGHPNMQAQVARDNSESAVMASAVRNCLRCLKSGVVAVRDMGCPR